ncbi:MAG: choloylglycine hydrolase [Candidatus Paralactobacillus gallistercoris]|uniref:choloylglycine hydrolase n=1 Tax=Candidatus Paralactobacillus gallistercoris TaxID=2838724 RepID=A0A948TK08_9LACO|nr:choloylglycine hydrolase [Candidatus Paralactobacillus gallistercoris]
MCTGLRFTDTDGNLFFGRNLDVESSYGEKVLVTPRNYPLPYKFLEDGKTTKAIIGMGIMAGDYPMYFDACNENGLGIAGLNFPRFAYFPKETVAGKKNMTPYEFMLWVMEEFDTVAEAKQGLQELSLIDSPFSPQMPVAPLHWIISDKEGALVVEATKEHGVQVYDNPVGVLTNNPDFPWHMMNLNNYVGLNPNDAKATMWSKQEVKGLGVGTGSLGLPGDSIPASRFVKVAYLNANYPTVKTEAENVAKFFNILKAVAMVDGSVVNEAGKREFTVYTACYSANTKTYYYNRYNDFEMKKVQMNDENMNADKVTIY